MSFNKNSFLCFSSPIFPTFFSLLHGVAFTGVMRSRSVRKSGKFQLPTQKICTSELKVHVSDSGIVWPRCDITRSTLDFWFFLKVFPVNVTCPLTSDLTLHLLPLHRPSSYHRLRARPFPGEEVPEVGGRWGFALLLRRLSHPDAALGRPGQTGAAAAGAASASAQGEAQCRAQRAPALLGVLGVLTVEPGEGGGLGQAEQVVVGVELTHVADGFTRRHVT